jgi:hypothetical protein
MVLTPAIKGQLTKVRNHHPDTNEFWQSKGVHYPPLVHGVRAVFAKHMPREQAKHAAKQYLATL